MKNIFNYFVALTVGLTTLFSCSVDDRTLDDDSQVFFTDTALTRTVNSTVTSADAEIPYSLTKAAEGSHTVNLEFDPNFSTAKPGVDFQILSGAEITPGQTQGVLKVRIFSAPALSQGKIANFRIVSPTLNTLQDNKSLSLVILKTCPLSTFVGNFTNTVGYWFDPGKVVTVIEDTTTPNRLIIKNFYNVDLPLVYNPATSEITIPNMQTGIIDPDYGMVSVRPATDGSKSSFNSCTRTIILNANYYVSAGSFGNGEERFVGN